MSYDSPVPGDTVDGKKKCTTWDAPKDVDSGHNQHLGHPKCCRICSVNSTGDGSEIGLYNQSLVVLNIP